jgi:hypothetical protein
MGSPLSCAGVNSTSWAGFRDSTSEKPQVLRLVKILTRRGPEPSPGALMTILETFRWRRLGFRLGFV